MSQLFLSDVDGELCVCWKGVNLWKPEYQLTHFPTGIKTRDFVSNYYPLDQCELKTMGSSYGVLKKGGYYTNTLTLHLKDGGKTKNIKYEVIPIPCPKVKTGINTRWNSHKECWEKELKKGWCTA
jgi:hypothetical protein